MISGSESFLQEILSTSQSVPSERRTLSLCFKPHEFYIYIISDPSHSVKPQKCTHFLIVTRTGILRANVRRRFFVPCPPSCHCSAMGRTAVFFIHPAGSPPTKIEQAHACSIYCGDLAGNTSGECALPSFRAMPALVPLLRNGANRRLLHPPGNLTNAKKECAQAHSFF